MPRFITAFLVSTCCTVGVAADWPQWQGPDRNAVSPETGLLGAWPEGGPTLAWRVDGLGGGDSAPAVAKGMLYGMSVRDGKEIVWALGEGDGRERWATAIGDAVEQAVPQSKEGPGGTPTVVGDRVYVIGMGGAVACLNADEGTILWRRDFTDDFQGVRPMWSYRESPLVDGDVVVCTPGGPDALLVALDQKTGETVWQTKPPADAAPTPAAAPPGPRGAGGPPAQASGPPQIEGTKDQALFLSEHWGMTGFSRKVPNGKYLAKLYFAETFNGITGPGQRVFTLDVQGKVIEDFDIWEKAGGPRKAHIESVPVEVTDGEFRIGFTRQTENPLIKAIELLPQPGSATDAEPLRIKAGMTTPFTDSLGQVWLADQGFEGGQTSPGFFNFPPGGGRGGFGGPRSGAGYSSVIAIDVEGERHYVQLTANTLLGVAAADGRILWKYDRPANRMGINCSTPIFADGLVFASSAYGNGGGAVRLVKGTDGAIAAEEVWFSNRMQNHHGGMIVVDGAIYGANGGNEGGFLTCMDFQTGEVLWRDRGAPKGALAMADGRLYLRAEDGTMLLIEPSRDELLVRGRFEQPDRSAVPAWAHPVIANGKLYIRDQGTLFCYDVGAE